MRKPETIKTTIIGCIAGEMGMHLPANSIKAADIVFKYIQSLTYKEFSEIKKYNKPS
jgi:hypothetical protein